MYLPFTVAQEQAHCASNIVPNSHFFHSKSTDLLIPKIWLLKFDFENPRSGSLVRSKFKVRTWVQHPIDSHPFGFMSIHPLIPMIRLFQNLTFTIQGQSHSSRSHSRYNILLIHIPFIPCWSALLCLRYNYFKNWPWMGEVKVQSHNVSLTSDRLTSLVSLTSDRLTSLWIHDNQSSHSWDTAFQNLIWKSKVKVIITPGHKVGITPYRLISLSFHVDWPSHSWDTAIEKFDVENSRSRSWVRSKLKVTTWVQHSVDSHPFCSMSIGHPIPALGLLQIWPWKSRIKVKVTLIHIPFAICQSTLPFLRYSIFKIWPWKSMVKVKWPWCCTTTGLDNSIELQMV